MYSRRTFTRAKLELIPSKCLNFKLLFCRLLREAGKSGGLFGMYGVIYTSVYSELA